MAITLNSVSQAATAGSSSFSVSHTVNAGANRVMLVFVSCPNSSDFMAAGSVSYGGTSLGAAVLTPSGNAGVNLYNYVFRMTNPPVGTANVVITPSGTAYLNVRVVTLDGVDQTTPISSSNSAKLSFAPGSSYSLPITSPADGVAVGAFVCRNTSSAIGALNGATEIGTITSDTASRMIVSMKANTTALDYSFTGSQPTLAASAVALNAATGGGTPPTGTVTIGTITPNSTGASVPFTYSAADQTGFEYRLNGGAAVTGTNSPQVLTGLTPSTAYTIEIRAVNASGAGSWSTAANFTTSAAGDTTPPVFTVAPTVTSVSQTTATVSATIDETGSIFWVVVPNAESTPSVAQVIAGQNAAGGTPTDSGSAVGTTTLSEGVTGMTANTAYKACFVARDDEGTPNVQAAVTTVSFTTAAVPTGTITSQPLVRNTGVSVGTVSLEFIDVSNPSTGELVVRKTGVSTNSSSVFTFNDITISTGVTYRIDWRESTGEFGTAYTVAT